jgi:hypothetical protein
MRNRIFTLDKFVNPGSVDLGAPPPAPVTVSACKTGQVVNPDGTCGSCDKDQGYEPSKEPKDGEVCTAIVVAVGVGGDLPGPKEEPKEKKEKDEKCKGFICPLPLLLLGGVIIGGVLLAKALKPKHKHNDNPQVATPPIATDPGTPVTPPVEPPITVPNPECLPPRTWVGTQCMLLIDSLPPPVIPTEGDNGSITAPGSAGGVR